MSATHAAPARKRALETPARLLSAGSKKQALETPAAARASGVVTTPARAGALAGTGEAALAPLEPHASGLSGDMPALWKLLDFTPEGAAALTPSQTAALTHIFAHYSIPPSLGPVSGQSGEERIFSAYYSGRLHLKPGHSAESPPPCCNLCAGQHLPSDCSAAYEHA